MEERISKYNLILDDVAIINLKFGPDFSKAIENKQIAQQEAETQVCYAIHITLNRVGYGGMNHTAHTNNVRWNEVENVIEVVVNAV